MKTRNPPMPPPIDRGKVWLTDLGMTVKVRPCLVLSLAPGPADRVLYTLVPHTTSVAGTAYEVAVPKPFLKPGAFDPQGIITVPRPRLIRRLGLLLPNELGLIEDSVRAWLGL
jgi:mRNA interferase MazF